MNTLLLGQSGSGKTTDILNTIKNTNKKVIILDFKSQYENINYPVFMLDYVSPILGILSVNDLKSINAGYVKDSHCLYKKGQEILNEYKLDSKEKLVEEVIERLYISWDNTEMAYAKLFSSKIPLRKHKNHITSKKAVEEILENDVTILRGKSMHSDHIRAVTFSLLTKLSAEFDEEVLIICDDLSTFSNNGNLKLFFETINFDKIDFLFSFNKVSNVSKNLLNNIDQFKIFQFENKVDLRDLSSLPIPVDASVKKLSVGKFITYNKETLEI